MSDESGNPRHTHSPLPHVADPPPLALRRTAIINRGGEGYEVWGQEGGNPEVLVFGIYVGITPNWYVAHKMAEAWRADPDRMDTAF